MPWVRLENGDKWFNLGYTVLLPIIQAGPRNINFFTIVCVVSYFVRIPVPEVYSCNIENTRNLHLTNSTKHLFMNQFIKSYLMVLYMLICTVCSNKHGNYKSNTKSSVLRISVRLPNFNGQDKVTSARVFLSKELFFILQISAR